MSAKSGRAPLPNDGHPPVGETVGNHEVIFSSPDETINLGHIANNRGIFAAGAIYAAKWGQDKKPGLFSMTNVLGL